MSTIPDDYSLDRAVPRATEYLTKEDCDPPVLKIISGMTWERFERDNGKDEIRAVLHFTDGKPMVLNQVNKEILQADFGKRTVGELKGLKIELYNDPNVMFGSKRVGGIRIRKPAEAVATPTRQEELNDDIPF